MWPEIASSPSYARVCNRENCRPDSVRQRRFATLNCHCDTHLRHVGRLLRCARNDGLWPKIASDLSLLGGSFGQEAILDCFQKIIDLAVVSTMTKA
jgi:hypothetical protein